jgi:L-cysteate sulfo-lyase
MTSRDQAANVHPEPDWLETIPRFRLGYLPTPLVPLDRLTTIVAPAGPRVWLKRDDCTGLATGGNKTRKLEYLLADAQRAGADSVLTFGAVQSNHARQTAAACAAAGLPCHLILTRRVRSEHPAYERSGNVQLEHLLGASVDLVAPADAARAASEHLAALRAAGGKPYVVPTGGSNATGALGYVRCAYELLQQARALGFRLSDVVHASSSGGTQAGLIAGFAMLAESGSRPAVHGINVYEHDAARLAATVLALARAVLQESGPADMRSEAAAAIAPADVRVDARYLGPDYGIPDAATIAAIRLLAQCEGVLLDPVYSGKAFAGLLDRLRRGEFAGVADVVFVHTGGTAVLPVYDHVFD